MYFVETERAPRRKQKRQAVHQTQTAKTVFRALKVPNFRVTAGAQHLRTSSPPLLRALKVPTTK